MVRSAQLGWCSSVGNELAGQFCTAISSCYGLRNHVVAVHGDIMAGTKGPPIGRGVTPSWPRGTDEVRIPPCAALMHHLPAQAREYAARIRPKSGSVSPKPQQCASPEVPCMVANCASHQPFSTVGAINAARRNLRKCGPLLSRGSDEAPDVPATRSRGWCRRG